MFAYALPRVRKLGLEKRSKREKEKREIARARPTAGQTESTRDIQIQIERVDTGKRSTFRETAASRISSVSATVNDDRFTVSEYT